MENVCRPCVSEPDTERPLQTFDRLIQLHPAYNVWGATISGDGGHIKGKYYCTTTKSPALRQRRRPGERGGAKRLQVMI